MRVGRPVKPLPQPVCDYCGVKAALVRAGGDAYPYREDHGPLWLCASCEAWIGVFARSRRHVPLGRLANAELREWKARLHDALEPLAAAKVRRDSCNLFEARARGMKWLAGEMALDEQHANIHQLDVGQCKTAIDIIEQFVRRRASPARLRRDDVSPDSFGRDDS
ncbi:zinc-finger-containing protein [Paraburkholderia sediminicola]|uniref:zinc-finger-containing protein n=1 Tax=Paraburkholderia sediminicola TaxID=458836 RepID=UPI0038BD4724